jgi:hypothetical protein
MSERKGKFTFNSLSIEVAQALLDAQVEVGNLKATIHDTEPFTKEENQKPTYQVFLKMRPGLLTGIWYRGHVLPGISTKDGSCVLIHEIHIQDEERGSLRIKGPGRVARAIGLERDATREIAILKATQPPVLRIS